jgi:hypothetical protein
MIENKQRRPVLIPVIGAFLRAQMTPHAATSGCATARSEFVAASRLAPRAYDAIPNRYSNIKNGVNSLKTKEKIFSNR